jgi:mannose-6-phosphate isomerase-like protein (cupin superfamily)
VSVQPSGFVRHEVWMAPEAEIPFDAREWRDAVVFIASGALVVDVGQGAPARFESGANLCFDGLQVRTLRNPGSLPLVLIAVSRPDR